MSTTEIPDAKPAEEKKSSTSGYYSWSTFPLFNKKSSEFIRPGDPVSPGDLDVNDEEFQELIDCGAVRKEKYPIPKEENFQGSVRDYYLAKLEASKEADEIPFSFNPTSTHVDPILQAQAEEALAADEGEAGKEAKKAE